LWIRSLQALSSIIQNSEIRQSRIIATHSGSKGVEIFDISHDAPKLRPEAEVKYTAIVSVGLANEK
jgi:hypothetical protein